MYLPVLAHYHHRLPCDRSNLRKSVGYRKLSIRTLTICSNKNVIDWIDVCQCLKLNQYAIESMIRISQHQKNIGIKKPRFDDPKCVCEWIYLVIIRIECEMCLCGGLRNLIVMFTFKCVKEMEQVNVRRELISEIENEIINTNL